MLRYALPLPHRHAILEIDFESEDTSPEAMPLPRGTNAARTNTSPAEDEWGGAVGRRWGAAARLRSSSRLHGCRGLTTTLILLLLVALLLVVPAARADRQQQQQQPHPQQQQQHEQPAEERRQLLGRSSAQSEAALTRQLHQLLDRMHELKEHTDPNSLRRYELLSENYERLLQELRRSGDDSCAPPDSDAEAALTRHIHQLLDRMHELKERTDPRSLRRYKLLSEMHDRAVVDELRMLLRRNEDTPGGTGASAAVCGNGYCVLSKPAATQPCTNWAWVPALTCPATFTCQTVSTVGGPALVPLCDATYPNASIIWSSATGWASINGIDPNAYAGGIIATNYDKSSCPSSPGACYGYLFFGGCNMGFWQSTGGSCAAGPAG